MQTKPVQQKSQVLIRYAEGKTLMAHQSAEAAVSEGVIKEKERFQRLVEHSPDAVAMVDAEMRYLCVSRRWETDFDSCGGDAIGRYHWELFPNLPEYWWQNARACLAGVLQYSEFVAARWTTSKREQIGVDGREWVKWSFQPWKNSDSSIGGLMISIEEVADKTLSINRPQKMTSEFKIPQLEISSELTQIALDSASDIVLCTSSDGQICYANQAACHLLGYSQS
ncbi:MAG TPA: PAS domain-containing sensor histidine kinase, partial [Microcoleaceae bacterium UBA10368]|nr:PAS domain-containing sensor histidine kinase [Microcoleaceae cyanobacterium UBA10368]